MSVLQTLEECEDTVLSKASQRCDRVKLTGELKGKCTRAQAVALESLKESILKDKDAFEKGPSSRNWLKILTRAQVHGKAVQDSSVVDGAIFDADRCLVKSYPTGEKFEERSENYAKNADQPDYSIAIRTTRANVSYIEVTKPNGAVELPVKCKDGTISFLEPVPKYVEEEVARLFQVMTQERKKFAHGNCVRGGMPDFGNITKHTNTWVSNL